MNGGLITCIINLTLLIMGVFQTNMWRERIIKAPQAALKASLVVVIGLKDMNLRKLLF